MFLRRAATALACSLFSTCLFAGDNRSAVLLARLSNNLPEEWTCSVTTASGKMGHPRGLWEPLFRIDCSTSSTAFSTEKGQKQNPSIRIHFHYIQEKSRIADVIRDQQLYSWDIPTTFAETVDYFVVTSPGWINGGYFTPAAKAAVAPIMVSLKSLLVSVPEELVGDPQLTVDLADLVRESATIVPGKTRGDLMKIFTYGRNPGKEQHQVMVHRRCPYIFMDVEISRKHKDLEDLEDVITSTSRAYLALPDPDS